MWEHLDWVIAKDVESGLVWTSLKVSSSVEEQLRWKTGQASLWDTLDFGVGHARFDGKGAAEDIQ